MYKERPVYEVTDLKLDNESLLVNETLFHNANGYLGVRSVFEEGYPQEYKSIRGQYINGFYDYTEVKQAEKLYGLVNEKQTMLNVVDTQSIRLLIEDEAFSMFEGTVLSSRRWVDMNEGVTVREVMWRSPKGKEAKIKITRMASFYQLPLFTIDYEVTLLNGSAEVQFESHHDGDVMNFGDPSDPRTAELPERYLAPISCAIRRGVSYIKSKTFHSGLEVCSAVKNVISKEHDIVFYIDNNDAICNLSVKAEQGEAIRLVKYTVLCDSIRYKNCRLQAAEEMDKALSVSMESMYEKQREYLDAFWENCAVKVDCDDLLNKAIHYNLYQMIQSVGKDKHSNIAPKGLSGEGYEGHFFWDSEMYIQPFFTITNPEIAKHLITYRYMKLPLAIENARVMGHTKGALFPWRTIMGRECSGYFPAGSAQYHINGDIAYSVVAYYLATKDIQFIEKKGAELLFETARLWLDVGNYKNGKFHINDVTGPDEYTCMVNNNYYTNVLAQYHLRWAVKLYNLIKSRGHIEKLADKINIADEEIAEFERAAGAMVLPYDEELDINPQDDSFLQKRPWPINSIPEESFPLLLHYHPLHLYRRQICKQPDALMAHYILEDAQREHTMRHSFDYYEKITTHDSSLSACIFSILAARLGLEEKACAYFDNAATLDLHNINKNTSDGIHTANMGGTYMAIVYGFGGFRLKESGIYFSPMLPIGWNSYRFKVCYEKSRIVVNINKDECIFTLETGRAKPIHVYGKEYILKNTIRIGRTD